MLPYITMPVTQNSMPVASFIVVQIDTGLVYVSEYGNNRVSVSKGGKNL